METRSATSTNPYYNTLYYRRIIPMAGASTYDEALLAQARSAGTGAEDKTQKILELRRARTRKFAMKLAELDALLPKEYRTSKQLHGAGRRSLELGGRTLESVLRDAQRFISEVRNRPHSGPAADHVGRGEKEPGLGHHSKRECQDARWGMHAGAGPDDAAAVNVNAEIRAGLLSSHSFICIEVELPLDASLNSPWTVVAASQRARALFEFEPWGRLSGIDLLQLIHPGDSCAMLSLDPRRKSAQAHALVRMMKMKPHHFLPDVRARTPRGDKADAGMKMDLPPDPWFEDPLFEDTLFDAPDDSHDSASAGPSHHDADDEKNRVFIARSYQTMRVRVSSASPAAGVASRRRALLVFECSHEDDVADESTPLSEVLEVFQAVNGVYNFSIDASSTTIGALRESDNLG
jgi:hypothetical protein